GPAPGGAPAAQQAPAAPVAPAAPAAPALAQLPGMQMMSPDMIAPMVCFLCTDYAWNINGQIFGVQGGQVSILNHPVAFRTIYKPGMWTLEELDEMVPRYLLQGTTNPAPPAPDIEVPGRPAAATA
ncbi:MAG TPA: hypothetical protein VNN10_06765, partial [Dehalococcoidia bacterium]|nr:hypothetical protein [Dehalococcoidia bacterium]